MDAIPLEEDSELSSNASHITKRETERRQLEAYWWSEFHAYYLRDLNRNYMATKRVKPIQLGQVVIAFEANRKRIDWPVGRVTELVHKARTRRSGRHAAKQLVEPSNGTNGQTTTVASSEQSAYKNLFIGSCLREVRSDSFSQPAHHHILRPDFSWDYYQEKSLSPYLEIDGSWKSAGGWMGPCSRPIAQNEPHKRPNHKRPNIFTHGLQRFA
ncbi:hypothetical protein DAPPUDRAFT_256272 [Daphnia pulex]|uniref:DUF5641 domain-containing protein n=1 Tax=Daphnia pulex TaxID=6669 RepID=E9HB14_DAPPU|nr:hypothetical protein DAPPUDRAFT_256272 [Daphnia pulex]|eukprot:EFX71050.1 hypothetical protein DAPPUDRAFT_256272 [Daphnia pulex]